MAPAYPIQSLPNGQVRMSDGTTVWPQSTNQGYIDTQRVPNTTTNQYNYQVPNAPAPSPSPSPARSSNGDEFTDQYWRDRGYSSRQDAIDKGALSGGNNVSDAQRQYEEKQRGLINSGWDQYTSQLTDMLNTGIPGQRTAQEQLAQNTYDTGVNTLGTQKESSTRQLQDQQASNLKDLADNVRNLFTAGNIYLGARGAGDSSAANQYSYAIAKMGSKARGDIQSQVSSRLNQIGDIYNTEINRLDSEKNAQLANIANWFNESQNQIRGMIGQAGLGRAQDLQALATNVYNQAIQAMQQVQAQQAQRRNVLESWAASNSSNARELAANLQSVGSSLPQFQGISTQTPQFTQEGSYYVPGSASTSQERDIFGNLIR